MEDHHRNLNSQNYLNDEGINMSLYDRSIKVNNPNLIKDGAPSSVGSSVNKSSFSKLRKQVQAIVTPDAMAEYMVSNPRKARAEVINAANHCLASDS